MSRWIHEQGPLIILSGPSGSGKSTLVARVLAEDRTARCACPCRRRRGCRAKANAMASITISGRRSASSRALRPASFFEYGPGARPVTITARCEARWTTTRCAASASCWMIDVQGAAKVRTVRPDAVSVFLVTSSLETYKQRLLDRGTEDEDAIARRLANGAARTGTGRASIEHVIVNDDLESTRSPSFAAIDRPSLLLERNERCSMN